MSVAAGDIDLAPYFPGYLDQVQTGTCEGHGHARAWATYDKAHGVGLDFIPSPDDVCKLARAHDRALFDGTAYQPLADDGTSSDSILWAAARYGVRPMMIPAWSDGHNSDVDPSTVDDEPEIDKIERDSATLIVGAYQVTETQIADRLAAVDLALANKIPVVMESFVDSAFEGWTKSGELYLRADKSDKNGGNHCTCIGARRTVDGVAQYGVDNSWGAEWCEGGRIWVAGEYVAGAMALVISSIRKGRRE
jgi:hypothetical protein